MTIDATQSAAGAIDTSAALAMPQPVWLETGGYTLNIFGAQAYLSDDPTELTERLRELYCILGPESTLEVREKATALCDRKIAQWEASLAEPGIADERLLHSPTTAISLWRQRRDLVTQVAQDILEQELAALHWFEGLLIRIAKVDFLHHQRVLKMWWEEWYQVSSRDSTGKLVPVKLADAIEADGLRITEAKQRADVGADSGEAEPDSADPGQGTPEVVRAAYELGKAYFHWRKAAEQAVRRRRMDARSNRPSSGAVEFPAPEAWRTLRETRQRYKSHGIIFSVYRGLIQLNRDLAETPQMLRKVERAVIQALLTARDEGQRFVDRLGRHRIFTPETINLIEDLPTENLNSVDIIEERYSVQRLMLEPDGLEERAAQLILANAATAIFPPLGVALTLSPAQRATAFWDAPLLQERLLARARMLADLVRQEVTGTEAVLGKGPTSSEPVSSMESPAKDQAGVRRDPGQGGSPDVWTRADLEEAIGHLKYALLSDEEVDQLTPEHITATLNSQQLPDVELLRWCFMPGTLTCRAALEGNIRTKAVLDARTDSIRAAQRYVSWVALAASAIPVVGEGAWAVAGIVELVTEGVLAPQELAKYFAKEQLNALTLDAAADSTWVSPHSAEVALILVGAGSSLLGLFPGTGMVRDATTGVRVYRLSRAALEVAASEVMIHAVTAAVYLGMEPE